MQRENRNGLDIATAVCGKALLAIGAPSYDTLMAWVQHLPGFLKVAQGSIWNHPDLQKILWHLL